MQIMETRIDRLQENEAMLNELEEQNKDSRETLSKLKDQNKILTTEAGGSAEKGKLLIVIIVPTATLSDLSVRLFMSNWLLWIMGSLFIP